MLAQFLKQGGKSLDGTTIQEKGTNVYVKGLDLINQSAGHVFLVDGHLAAPATPCTEKHPVYTGDMFLMAR